MTRFVILRLHADVWMARRKLAHSVLHRFLHEVEPLPAGVKLVLVGAFEVQQVTDDLCKDADVREVTVQQHGNRFMFTVSAPYLYKGCQQPALQSCLTLIMENRDLVSSSECSRM